MAQRSKPRIPEPAQPPPQKTRLRAPAGLADGEVLVDGELIHDIELKLSEFQQSLREMKRLLDLATGKAKPSRTKIQPTASPTGLKSKCVELSRRHRLFIDE
jgi:hypothetical protein